jgi:hypothetical protein
MTRFVMSDILTISDLVTVRFTGRHDKSKTPIAASPTWLLLPSVRLPSRKVFDLASKPDAKAGANQRLIDRGGRLVHMNVVWTDRAAAVGWRSPRIVSALAKLVQCSYVPARMQVTA